MQNDKLAASKQPKVFLFKEGCNFFKECQVSVGNPSLRKGSCILARKGYMLFSTLLIKLLCPSKNDSAFEKNIMKCQQYFQRLACSTLQLCTHLKPAQQPLKGIVQRDLTGVETRLKRSALINYIVAKFAFEF
jgi:hypothetical protein